MTGIRSRAGVPARLSALAGIASIDMSLVGLFAASGGTAGRDARATDAKKIGKLIHPIAVAVGCVNAPLQEIKFT